MRPRVEVAVERGDAGQRGPQQGDGVDALFGLGAGRFDAAAFELEPGEAAVLDRDVEVGALGQDGGRGVVARHHVFGAEALPLLVGAAGHEQVAAQRRPAAGRAGLGGEALGDDHGGGESGLHVVAAATVETAVAQLRGEHLGGAADHVEVAHQHEGGRVADRAGAIAWGVACRAGVAASVGRRARGAPVVAPVVAGQRGDEVRPPGSRFPDVDREPGGAEAAGEEAHERFLARRPGHEAGVGRIDRDKIAEQPDQVFVGRSHAATPVAVVPSSLC